MKEKINGFKSEKTKKYEGIFILNYKLTENHINEIIERLTDNVAKIKSIEKVGKKNLGYSAKGHKKGYFIIIYFEATDEQRAKIELTAKDIAEIIKFIIFKD